METTKQILIGLRNELKNKGRVPWYNQMEITYHPQLLEEINNVIELIEREKKESAELSNCNKPHVINNEVAVCDHHWLGVGDWDGYAMEQCTKCNLFREAN